jgi:hypothetical protein
MSETFPLPGSAEAVVAAPAPGRGPQFWAGAPSAVLDTDGTIVVGYRVRNGPDTTDETVVARSSDGERLETVLVLDQDHFGAQWTERPALVRLPGSGWRMYVSCATPGTKHWWVDSLTAERPDELPWGERRMVHSGDDRTAVKDPVITLGPNGWRMWLCCHPLDLPGHEDRMTTRLLVSNDGLDWVDRGEVLAGRPGQWDARGARVTAELTEDPLTVLYDGRADAESNWFETTGVAHWDGTRLVADDHEPLVSPYSDGAWRYASAVPLPDGRTRFYVEAARPDGAHDLVTLVR